MTVQTLKTGRQRFVILREKDYLDLLAKAKARVGAVGRRLSAQDRGDIAEAKRRKDEPARPYAEMRQRPTRQP